MINSNVIKANNLENYIYNKKSKYNNFENTKSIISILKSKNKILINIFLFIVLMLSILTENSIKLIIKRIGMQKLLNQDFTPQPSAFFQDQLKELTNNAMEITGTENDENEIILSWTSTFDNCDSMFSGLENIIEVDFSDFTPIKRKFTRNMFTININLKIIKFDNFDTSLCENMHHLFSNCYSLESLNLSNFDTSSLTNIDNMFYNCSSLETLFFI